MNLIQESPAGVTSNKDDQNSEFFPAGLFEDCPGEWETLPVLSMPEDLQVYDFLITLSDLVSLL